MIYFDIEACVFFNTNAHEFRPNTNCYEYITWSGS